VDQWLCPGVDRHAAGHGSGDAAVITFWLTVFFVFLFVLFFSQELNNKPKLTHEILSLIKNLPLS